MRPAGSRTRSARKPARKATRKVARKARPPAKKSARRPRRATPVLRLVKRKPPARKSEARPAPPAAPVEPAPPAFAGAKAQATAKELVLFELERARVAVHAAIQGMSAASADQPIGPGKWSPRQIVLHLAQWDREVAGWVDTVYATNRPMPFDWSRLNEHNARRLAEVEHVGWDDARRMLQTARGEILAALESIPDEPAEVWTREHALGKMTWFIPKHDRRHADQIKSARSTSPPDAP